MENGDTLICPYCDGPICADNIYEYNGDFWCGQCVDENSFISHYSGQRFGIEDKRHVFVVCFTGDHVQENWSQSEVAELATYCAGSRRYYRNDEFNFVKLASGEVWVDWFYAKVGTSYPLSAGAGDLVRE